MLRVYLAAPYQCKNLMRVYAVELRALGIEITSSWLEEPHRPAVQMHEVTPEERHTYAQRDIEDIANSHMMVFFNDTTKKVIRAGRHVEFGIVLGIVLGIGLTRPMPIYVVGEEFENLFHHCDQVTHFPNWQQVKTALIKLDIISEI